MVPDPALVNAYWSTAKAMKATAGSGATNVVKQAEKKEQQQGQGQQKQGEQQPDTERKQESVDKDKPKPSKSTQEKVISFVVAQKILKQEDPRCETNALRRKATALENRLQELLRVIKATSKEKDIEELETKLANAVQANMRWFPKSRASKVHPSTSMHPDMPKCFSLYQKMLWLLQYQSSYLAALSKQLEDDRDQLEIFLTVVEKLFADVLDTRADLLFLNLLRIMIYKEAETIAGADLPMEMFLLNEESGGRPKSVVFEIFKRKALQPLYCRDLARNILGYKDSILSEVQRTFANTTSDKPFAFSFDEFKTNLGAEARTKDEAELITMYAKQIATFREFMNGAFMTALQGMKLPSTLRQAMHFVHSASLRWNNQAPSSEEAIDKELRSYEPALRLLFFAILKPLLSEAAHYLSPKYYFERPNEELEELTRLNLQSIDTYLQQMLSNSIDKKEKTLLNLAKQVKVQLLKYVRDQCDVEDTLIPDVLMTLFRDQFSRKRTPVMLSTFDLMNLSNMLKEQSSKIALKESDPLQEICKDIPDWSDDVVFMTKQKPLPITFYMESSFFKDEEIVLCSETSCPLPAWACAHDSRKRLVSVGGGVANKEDSSLFLEGLLKQLKPLEAKTFPQLRDELQQLRNDMNSQNSSEDMDKQRAAELDKAILIVEQLINVKADAAQFMESIAERVRGRAKEFRYLDSIEMHEAKTSLAKQAYDKQIVSAEKQLKEALSTSLELGTKVPTKLVRGVGEQNMYFKTVLKKLQEVATGKHKIPEELKTSNVPMTSYKVMELKKMKVVSEIIKVPFASMEDKMKISIRKLDGGGAELTASIFQAGSQNVIEKIILDPAKLQELKHADKTHTAGLGDEADPFLTVWSANFMKLIVKLERGG